LFDGLIGLSASSDAAILHPMRRVYFDFRHRKPPPFLPRFPCSPALSQDAEKVRQRHRPWRVKRETCEKSTNWCSKFKKPRPLDLAPSSVSRVAHLLLVSLTSNEQHFTPHALSTHNTW